jgi:hypothetical protein
VEPDAARRLARRAGTIMTEPGQAYVLGLHLVTLLATLSELLPRLWTLWRLRGDHNGLLAMRVTTIVKSTGIALLAGWAAMIRYDVVFARGDIAGSGVERWQIDAVIWTVLALGALSVCWLYWRTVRQQDQRHFPDERIKREREPGER